MVGRTLGVGSGFLPSAPVATFLPGAVGRSLAVRHGRIAAASVLAAARVALGWNVLTGGSSDGASGPGLGPGSGLRVEGVAGHVRDGDAIEVGGVAARIATLDRAETDTEAGQVAGERMAQLAGGEAVACALEAAGAATGRRAAARRWPPARTWARG